jgi:hypothetical protein
MSSVSKIGTLQTFSSNPNKSLKCKILIKSVVFAGEKMRDLVLITPSP